MTSKLTRERLEKIKSWRETYGAGSNVMLPAEEAEELACLALAALDTEPVAEVLSNRPGNDTSTIDRALPVGTQLYRHAQPVVPQDVLEALQKVARIRLDMNDFDGDRRGIADCLCDAEEALIEVVNRRAAMLAAAPQSPGSEPDTVPGKWVPVSERMPEAEGHYLVWANASRIDGYCDHLAIATYQGGEWSNEFNRLVNHWMPLPAAPQEVKGE
ncbi:TPA: DUF551 domain-containing protein [Klebsiella pneumoniae]|nr:DUF551 domain-containing protein [Klebsiella pneumoniae]